MTRPDNLRCTYPVLHDQTELFHCMLLVTWHHTITATETHDSLFN